MIGRRESGDNPPMINKYKTITVPFLQALKEAGYVEGGAWRSNIVGQRTNPIACRRLQRISSAGA
jgi:hypothetical protein